MGSSSSNCLKMCNYVLDCQSPKGLVVRQKNFEDAVKSIKKEDGWGLSRQYSHDPIEIGIEKINIKDAICENAIEDETTIDCTISADSEESAFQNTVKIYQSKIHSKDDKSFSINSKRLSSLNKRFVCAPLVGYTICSKLNRNKSRQKRTISRSNRMSSININMTAFSNLVVTKDKLKRKAESLCSRDALSSPMSTMPMRF